MMSANQSAGVQLQLQSDGIAKLVAIVLAGGVFMLFVAPTSSGNGQSFGFSEYRFYAGLLGYDWAFFLAGIGVVAAFGAALLLEPGGRTPRSQVITIGSILGMAVLAPALMEGYAEAGGVEAGSGVISDMGFGMGAYLVACLVASATGFNFWFRYWLQGYE